MAAINPFMTKSGTAVNITANTMPRRIPIQVLPRL
jgi:hypothetical protein